MNHTVEKERYIAANPACVTNRFLLVALLTGLITIAAPAWGQVINEDFKLLASDRAAFDQFGLSIAIANGVVAIGAHLDDDNGSAYLFDASPGKCPWDLDKSGSVGTGDLLELFAQWGTAGPADFDGSGAVGTSDLLILFANWGPCP